MTPTNSRKPAGRAEHAIRAERLFTMIAPLYDLVLARSMARVYRKAVDLLLQAYPRAPHPMPTALDVGTGTGLFASELARGGFQVTAIDSCSAMLRVAQRHRPRAADYIQAEAHLASRQPGAPFDLVCAGMLLHGLPREYRAEVLADMTRAACKAVVIVDYVPPANPMAAAVECLEGSYYRDFLHEFGDDLACAGADALVYPLTSACALYLVPLCTDP